MTSHDHHDHQHHHDQAQAHERASEGHEKGHQGGSGHHDHHARMVADFRRRFWVSLILTVPVLVLAPMIQRLLGLEETLAFPGDSYLQFAFASVVFFFGGWPFLKGFFEELGRKKPGMMTLIALAITVAYAYSSVVVFGLPGEVFESASVGDQEGHHDFNC